MPFFKENQENRGKIVEKKTFFRIYSFEVHIIQKEGNGCARPIGEEKKQQSSKHQKKNRIYKSRYFFYYCNVSAEVLLSFYSISKNWLVLRIFLLPGNYTMNKKNEGKTLKTLC